MKLERHSHALEAFHQTLGLSGVGELLGHLLQHLKLLEQTVDVHHLGTGSGGNALFPAGVEHGGILSLIGGHGLDDGLNFGQLLFVHIQIHLFAAHAGKHRGDVLHGTHAFQLDQLIVVVVQGELVLVFDCGNSGVVAE